MLQFRLRRAAGIHVGIRAGHLGRPIVKLSRIATIDVPLRTNRRLLISGRKAETFEAGGQETNLAERRS